MEEIGGVGACVLGDMAARPNLGLNELDFVFCTLVVSAILNLSLMYMLAPTSAGGAVTTHGQFTPGHCRTCVCVPQIQEDSLKVTERTHGCCSSAICERAFISQE